MQETNAGKILKFFVFTRLPIVNPDPAAYNADFFNLVLERVQDSRQDFRYVKLSEARHQQLRMGQEYGIFEVNIDEKLYQKSGFADLTTDMIQGVYLHVALYNGPKINNCQEANSNSYYQKW